ncbi:hypothetical protein [Hoeflea sp. TYP-13]|uniref:hypothetical protein n=1 Tax=Hoeflea sp. TYP-13 TaxID=3230023 RepID=UPI0034C63B3E
MGDEATVSRKRICLKPVHGFFAARCNYRNTGEGYSDLPELALLLMAMLREEFDIT